MFPYLAPIKDWAKDVLEDRENTPIDSNLKLPWVILTSGAKVLKEKIAANAEDAVKQYEDLISNQDKNTLQYSGCIIKSNMDVASNYQLNESIIGYDFNGKPIKVEGEVNKRISTPIIESVDIDTDGANNTLKVAKVNIRCFSLKQFEMFELFFCKPGMNVLLEFGNNVLSRKSYPPSKDAERPNAITDVKTALVNKNNYGEFKTSFSNYYRVNDETFRKYMINVESSRGTYDLVAGKVTDFNFSIDNGTYTVMIEISQGNQMTLAIPVNTTESANTIQSKNIDKTKPYTEWLVELSAQLGLDYTILKDIIDNNKLKTPEKEFFNWGKLNKDKKDESASSDSYISFRFILKILLNYILYKDGKFNRNDWEFILPTYKSGVTDIETIPIKIHKNLISSSPEILFPNESLPKFTGDKNGIDIVVDKDKRLDGRINGYSIVESSQLKLNRGRGSIEVNKTNGDLLNGNALNIFIKWDTVVQLWKKSYTRIDFLTGVLDIINSNSYGLFRLVYAPIVDGGKASIIDVKSTGVSDSQTPIYRFKVNSVKSIVKDFSFNFEMSNLVAGRTIFNAQRFLVDSFKNVPKEKQNSIELPADAYRSYDNSLFSNADGYYSINVIDLEALKTTFKDAKERGVVGTSENSKPNEGKNITEIIDNQITKFKTADSKELKLLIFNNIDLIYKIVKSDEREKSTLTPIDVSLTIDGLSGLSCGEYFHIDGVPEMYNKIGVFQITNISHTITNEGGWDTKIEAGFRIKNK
jgi:hypothetical protein